MAYTNIDDPSAYFQTALYTGTGSAQSITNDGNSDLQPDFIWFKRRNSTVVFGYFNSTTGNNKYLYTGNGDSPAEVTASAGEGLQTFDSDGFSLGTHQGPTNASGGTYVAWQWKANGGTTSSNTDGSITSTVQVNQDAGFSIVTYTGTGVYNKTVGHGLGVAPAVVILKNRTTGETSYDDWWVYHKDTSNPVNRGLRLNEDVAEVSTTVLWSVVPSSTIFGVGGSVDLPRYTNEDSDNYVAYCFAEKQGYSKFGKYIGNGSTNGPFVYTGFKPAFIMRKRIDGAGNWGILDYKRDPTNLADQFLSAEANSAESNYLDIFSIDILSNGFKFRTNRYESNQLGSTYIYMAFAENPFVTSTGVPTTAR
jgi:hypothetical protein